MNKSQMDLVLRLATVQHFAPGQLAITQGEAVDRVHLLANGTLKQSPGGGEHSALPGNALDNNTAQDARSSHQRAFPGSLKAGVQRHCVFRQWQRGVACRA